MGRSKICSVFGMCSNISNHQLKIDCYTHRLLYMKLLETTNEKNITDTQKIKRNESKHNIKESHQITGGKNKRRRKEERIVRITRKWS